jgi:hypothetical protein
MLGLPSILCPSCTGAHGNLSGLAVAPKSRKVQEALSPRILVLLRIGRAGQLAVVIPVGS